MLLTTTPWRPKLASERSSFVGADSRDEEHKYHVRSDDFKSRKLCGPRSPQSDFEPLLEYVDQVSRGTAEPRSDELEIANLRELRPSKSVVKIRFERRSSEPRRNDTVETEPLTNPISKPGPKRRSRRLCKKGSADDAETDNLRGVFSKNAHRKLEFLANYVGPIICPLSDGGFHELDHEK